MAERVIMARLLKDEAPGREFDIEFWQKLGPSKILAAAWDLVVTAASARGISEDQLQLRDLLQSLNEERVRYLVVSGYAWMVHREPRYTKDLDVGLSRSMATPSVC